MSLVKVPYFILSVLCTCWHYISWFCGFLAPCSVVVGYERFRGPFYFCLHFKPEDGGSTEVRNSGIQLTRYAAQQHRKSRIVSSPPWEPHIFLSLLTFYKLSWLKL